MFKSPTLTSRSPAIFVSLFVCSIYAAANFTQVTATWEFDDVHAYLNAAQRLLDGGPLYVTTPDPSDLYLYAPWFAFAWVPFTVLPLLAVEVAWAAVLLASTVAAVMPFRSTWAGIALALLLGGLLYRTAGWGNVQPLLVAALIYAVPTRAGPWAIGVAGSLKPLALGLLVVHAWRREWRSVGIGLGVAAVLWLPILFFGLSSYPFGLREPNLYDATILLVVPGLVAGVGDLRRPIPALSGIRRRARIA
ncbi:MAG TPA: glycosyltransferase family 87 protein [Candidatus Limnocylindria bacterium]|nr:glycosyltransferase family 87 protein [Candidatus Limnocylindria bacterium]